MRTLIRSALAAALLTLVVAGASLAKGEQMSATIGPIDDISAGTPTAVKVDVAVNGAPTAGTLPVYLDFLDPNTGEALEFPVKYDRNTGSFTAQVTLPHEGNWVVNALLRSSAGPLEPIGRVDGTRLAIVKPAPLSPAPEPSTAPALLGAGLASAVWVAVIALYAIRRRGFRPPAQVSTGERQPA